MAFNPSPNTDEIYAVVTWTFLNVKYSHSINDTFGVPNSKNSYFIETNVAYPLPSLPALTLTGPDFPTGFAGDEKDIFGGFAHGMISSLRSRSAGFPVRLRTMTVILRLDPSA